jgi:hypothetical protein
MEHQRDFKELLELFNGHKVDYLIVGAYALAFHGAPRMTGDLDILVRPTPGNAKRILDALRHFGFGTVGLTEGDFVEQEQVVQLGVPPVRVDLLTSLTGVTFEEADSEKAAGEYGGVPVHYIGREQLIKNKRATGRLRDQADLEALGEAG